MNNFGMMPERMERIPDYSIRTRMKIDPGTTRESLSVDPLYSKLLSYFNLKEIADGKWHSFCVTVTEENVKAYLD